MSIYAPINRIQSNPWQTRHSEPDPAYIKELALDIAANGLLQIPLGRLVDSEGAPVEVAWPDSVIEMKFHEGNGLQVQLAFGHNRLAAFRWLYDLKDNSDIPGDFSHIPIDLRQLTDEQMAIMAWAENEKRRDVTAIERAWAIQQRIKDFEWSNRECADALGIDHSTVANILRLLKLPDDVQQLILRGELTERQAQALLPLYDAPIDLKRAPDSYYYDSPRVILRDAVKNSSDRIRDQVSKYLDIVSEDLSKAEFKLDKLMPEEGAVYCGLCSTCDKRMASRNRCFDGLCFQAKTNYVRRKYLEKASFSSGYGILDEQKASNPTPLPHYPDKKATVIATKCENLVLEYTSSKREDSLEHFPHARLVCEMRNGSCRCRKGLDALGKMEADPKSEVPGTIEEAVLDPNGDPLPEIDYDGIAAEELGVNVTPAPVGAADLEEAARQARKAKNEAINRLGNHIKALEEHLYRCILDQNPGALYAAVHRYMYASLRDRIDLDAIWHYLANEATRVLLPTSFDSEADLVKQINENLDRLNIPALGSEEKQPEVEFPVF